ncbi:MAG: hypothetical protein UR66_C0012G0005 [Candidatus Moranbacteria bacterium GW2011_GWE1_35_17]|nr:MAG: hypothetical protein UR66_C0012G0005 [Candidatus Moranbacteria bacterium GW2011_GWE1_35_17]KKP73314.1 MAG: hypothetical protein UR65_C0004G0005 [Candidatus Moranbacteria bacterium GW2011_GWE2_35_164]KKP85091.1 MAG: hypothetical protein UR83_C0005G0007 [Candidatus Moranbacteria bacterium GW2011_GWF2_35_54]
MNKTKKYVISTGQIYVLINLAAEKSALNNL